MAAPTSIIKYILYTSPYAELPPGIYVSGLMVQADTKQIPPSITNPILVIRLRTSTDTVIIGQSPTDGAGVSDSVAVIQPTFPLSATAPYMVDVIWVPKGTPPAGIAWDNALASSPVIASDVSIVTAKIKGLACNVQLSYGASAVSTGAQVILYSLSGGTWVRQIATQIMGDFATLTLPATIKPPYRVYAQAIIPAANQTGNGSFTSPFSLAPVGEPRDVPQAVKAIKSIDYNGSHVAVSWDLDAVASAVSPQSSIVKITDQTGEIVSVVGGASSAIVPFSATGMFSKLKVSIELVANNISTCDPKLDHEFALTAPSVTKIATQGQGAAAAVTATLVEATQTGNEFSASLCDQHHVLKTISVPASGLASFKFDATGKVGLNIIARVNNVKTTPHISGPQSAPVTVLATAPQLSKADIRTDSKSANWRIECAWERLPDAASVIENYSITVLDINNKTALATATTSDLKTVFSIPKAKIPAGGVAITIVANGLNGTVSPSEQIPLFFAPPILQSVTTTSDKLMAGWAPPAGLPTIANHKATYEMIVVDNSNVQVATSGFVSSTAAAVTMAALAAQTSKSAVKVRINCVLGPVSLTTDASMGTGAEVAAITTSPSLNPVAIDPNNNKAILSWKTAGAGFKYVIEFNDLPDVSSAAVKYTMPTAIPNWKKMLYRVQVQNTAATPFVIGPPSDWAAIQTSPVLIKDVHYDGTNVTVKWEMVEGVKEYLITIYDKAALSSASIAQGSVGNSAILPFVADPKKSYIVHVQVAGPNGTGPTHPATDLFTPAFFVSKQPAKSAIPYAYFSQDMASLGTTAANPAKKKIDVYLPEICTKAGGLGTAAINVAPFTLLPPQKAGDPYKLTIAASDLAWKFDTTAMRQNLQVAYDKFLKKIEAPGGVLTGVSAYGMSLVQSAIARILPQTFEEQLFYNYGLSTSLVKGGAHIDLRAGMVLRLVQCDFIDINQMNLPSWVNGYAGANIVDIEIGSYSTANAWKNGFSGFFNFLAANGALDVQTPFPSPPSAGIQAGSASAIDLYYPQFQQPFYRLLIPAKIWNPSQAETNDPAKSFALAAAPSYTSLTTSSANTTKNAVAYFRGRTTVEVMIKVRFNGEIRLVPIGTTLGNLLEQFGMRPAANSPVLNDIRLKRSILPVSTDPDGQKSLGPNLDVQFNWGGFTSYATGFGQDVLSLPLLSGDQINLSKPGG